jgi:hypothetical protein
VREIFLIFLVAVVPVKEKVEFWKPTASRTVSLRFFGDPEGELRVFSTMDISPCDKIDAEMIESHKKPVLILKTFEMPADPKPEDITPECYVVDREQIGTIKEGQFVPYIEKTWRVR